MNEMLEARLEELGWYQIHADSPAPDDYIAQVEAELGPLPADYRDFLTHFPAQSGPDAVVTCPIMEGIDEGGDPDFLVAFGFCTRGSNLLAINTDDDIAVPNMIIVGDDSFGNWFYCDLADGPMHGSIWFYDRDGSLPLARDGLALVGHSFTDFVNRMVIDPDGDTVPVAPKRNLWQRLRDWLG